MTKSPAIRVYKSVILNVKSIQPNVKILNS